MPESRRTIPSTARLVGFAAAMQYRSFTRAAAALGMTQAAISRQIKELEDELGTSLFVRSARDVIPTPAAVLLGEAIVPALERIGSAVADVRQEADTTQSVTVFTDHSLASSFILPKVIAFEARHPSVKVRILSSNAAIETVAEPYDLAVQHGYPPGKGFDSLALASETIFPVAAPHLVARLSQEPTLQEIARLPLLDFRQPSHRWIDWTRFFSQFGLQIDVAPRAQFDSYIGAIDAALAGQGAVLGWGVAVGPHIDRGSLVQIGDWTVDEPGGLRVYFRANRERKGLAARLAEWLAS